MRILGVDPSFNRSGWSVVEWSDRPTVVAAGVISPKGQGRPIQLVSIRDQFDEIVRSLQPDAAFFERPGAWQRKGGTRRETIEVLSMGRAVMLLACAVRDLPAYEVEVHLIRKAMFGRVNALPADVVTLLLGRGFTAPLRPRGGTDMDICNALVMCLYGAATLFPDRY